MRNVKGRRTVSKRTKAGRPRKKRREEGRPGRSLARPASWMSLEAFEECADEVYYEHLQATHCRVGHGRFVKPIVGVHRGLSRGVLENRLQGLRCLLFEYGGEVEVDHRMPLWWSVEWLENVVEYELAPPCGCDPLPQLVKAAA